MLTLNLVNDNFLSKFIWAKLIYFYLILKVIISFFQIILKIALYTKSNSNENFHHIFSLIKILEKNKIICEIDENIFELISKNKDSKINCLNVRKFIQLDKSFDYVVAVGGDGTFLRAAKEIADLNIPIIGINKGRLGFLASSNIENMYQIVKKLANKEYEISERTLIEVEIDGSKKYALNEIAISRKNTTSLISIKTMIDNQYLNTYWADGLIISTPTGSTGYSLSCGGPIILPDAESLVFTPIAPHNLNARPLVVPDNKKIDLEIYSREKECLLSADSEIFSIPVKTKLSINKSKHKLQLIDIGDLDPLNTLREKLLWGKDKRTEQ